MATRYFKKIFPKKELYLQSTGKRIVFDRIDEDLGYFKTDDAGVQADLDWAIANESGGVIECSQEEFDGFIKKKAQRGSSPPPKPRWREEIGMHKLPDTSTSISPIPPLDARVAPEPKAESSGETPVTSLRQRVETGRR